MRNKYFSLSERINSSFHIKNDLIEETLKFYENYFANKDRNFQESLNKFLDYIDRKCIENAKIGIFTYDVTYISYLSFFGTENFKEFSLVMSLVTIIYKLKHINVVIHLQGTITIDWISSVSSGYIPRMTP